MNGYNTKNYTAHGGAETVIGGKLTFLPGAEVEGLERLLGKTADAPRMLSCQKLSEATTVAALREDFNRLLARLRDAGLMAEAEAESPVEAAPAESNGEAE